MSKQEPEFDFAVGPSGGYLEVSGEGAHTLDERCSDRKALRWTCTEDGTYFAELEIIETCSSAPMDIDRGKDGITPTSFSPFKAVAVSKRDTEPQPKRIPTTGGEDIKRGMTVIAWCRGGNYNDRDNCNFTLTVTKL